VKPFIPGFWVRRGAQSYTLVELLCSIAIILLVAALLLPALRTGYAKAQRIYCVNNLHQMGLGFHSFAQSHQDRFPMQVSTNEGGALELREAGNTMTGAFYFSYRYFVPLANELAAPKILHCPTDTRHAATNFADLQNEHLSYFAAGNPEFGNSHSVLAGNRNLTPAFGSVARVGGYRQLMWTEELHRFKGNVLFSDAHVEQLNDMFSLTNGGTAPVASLHMPSVRPPPPAPGTTVQSPHYEYVGGGRSGGRTIPFAVPGYTNQFGTNQGVTNWYVTGGRSRGSLQGFSEVETVAAGGAPPLSTTASRPNVAGSAAPLARQGEAEVPWWSLKEMYQQVITKGPTLLRGAAVMVYDIPWYLLLLLLVALLELRRRLRAQRQDRLRSALARAASLRGPGAEARTPHPL
jgi:prepilin-type processing-associated H-X9-DG protein